jgi:3-dehydroquinate synthase
MSILKVNLLPRDYSYQVEIVDDFLDNVRDYVRQAVKTDQYAIIADENICKIYGAKIKNQIKKGARKVELISFPAGEKSKNWEKVGELARKMIQLGFDRKCCIIALGGGVTGDLAGLVASVFLRGVALIQIPTSLLAMVDSSIGGKTGVDVLEGKNLMGTFYQPRKVITNISFLDTLPESEFLNGLAEVVKHSVIWDRSHFLNIAGNARQILKRDPIILKKIITKTIQIKAEIVMKDEQEARLRRILNFGHTFGHAIEAQSKYKLLHGQAVAMGMHFACRLAEEFGFSETEKIIRLLKQFKLPVCPDKNYDHGRLLKKMYNDKKSVRGKIYFVLPKKIGEVFFAEVDECNLREHLRSFQETCGI